MKSCVNVALIQHQAKANVEAAMRYLSEQIGVAANAGAELIVLQELHNTPYFCQTENPQAFDLAEPIPGPSSAFFSNLAQQYQVVIVASLFERRAPGLHHNTAVVFEKNGELIGQYRKMHIPDDPGYYEKYYFTPGDLGFKPIESSVGKLGVLVCWDQWFPEAARCMALNGAELLIYPTAIGWDQHDEKDEQARQREAWQIIQRGHAIANGLPVVVCNRVGFEASPNKVDSGQTFWGSSFVAGPQGEWLAQADESNECIVHCVVDKARTETVRRAWPFLRDRRIDAYTDILKRYV